MRRIEFPGWREVLTLGAFPRPLGLVWGEANQRAELILVLGFRSEQFALRYLNN